MLSFGIQGGVIRYWAVIALHAVYRSQKNAKTREREAFELKVQASELARQLATAQLSSLKMQLQPHFLFNTLGAIMVLIQQQKTAQAEGMVEKLGDLLRLTLESAVADEGVVDRGRQVGGQPRPRHGYRAFHVVCHMRLDTGDRRYAA